MIKQIKPIKCNQCKEKVNFLIQSKTGKEIKIICSQCLWEKIGKAKNLGLKTIKKGV